MKPHWTGMLLLLASTTLAAAQGLLDYSNFKPGHGIDAPVYDTNSTTRLGDQFLSQLYAGVTTNALVPIGYPVSFRNNPGTSAGSGYVGYPIAGVVVVGTAPGAAAYVELRAWPSNAGPTFEAAVSAGARTGRSPAVQVTMGGALFPPSALSGLQSFSLAFPTAINQPPVSSGFGGTTPKNQPLLVTYTSLLSPISDPDGGPVHIVSVGNDPIYFGGQMVGTVEMSTNGALVVSDYARATYIPNQDFVGADRFSYVVGDSHGATNTVYAQIAVLPPGVQANAARTPAITPTGGMTFNFAGLPGRTYEVQRAGSVAGPWLAVGTFTVAPDGNAVFLDSSPLKGSGFYRTALLQ